MKLKNGTVINPLFVVLIPAHTSGGSITKYKIPLNDGSCVYVDHEEAEELREFLSQFETLIDEIQGHFS